MELILNPWLVFHAQLNATITARYFGLFPMKRLTRDFFPYAIRSSVSPSWRETWKFTWVSSNSGCLYCSRVLVIDRIKKTYPLWLFSSYAPTGKDLLGWALAIDGKVCKGDYLLWIPLTSGRSACRRDSLLEWTLFLAYWRCFGGVGPLKDGKGSFSNRTSAITFQIGTWI